MLNFTFTFVGLLKWGLHRILHLWTYRYSGKKHNMFANYIQELPLPNDSISPKLWALLTPIGLDPFEKPEVSSRYEHDQYGPQYEAIHMIIALTDGPETISVDDFDETSDGVVSFSTPIVDECGGLVDPAPNKASCPAVRSSNFNVNTGFPGKREGSPR